MHLPSKINGIVHNVVMIEVQGLVLDQAAE